jgi:hypothetical protein
MLQQQKTNKILILVLKICLIWKEVDEECRNEFKDNFEVFQWHVNLCRYDYKKPKRNTGEIYAALPDKW